MAVPCKYLVGRQRRIEDNSNCTTNSAIPSTHANRQLTNGKLASTNGGTVPELWARIASIYSNFASKLTFNYRKARCPFLRYLFTPLRAVMRPAVAECSSPQRVGRMTARPILSLFSPTLSIWAAITERAVPSLLQFPLTPLVVF